MYSQTSTLQTARTADFSFQLLIQLWSIGYLSADINDQSALCNTDAKFCRCYQVACRYLDKFAKKTNSAGMVFLLHLFFAYVIDIVYKPQLIRLDYLLPFHFSLVTALPICLRVSLFSRKFFLSMKTPTVLQKCFLFYLAVSDVAGRGL